MNTLNVPKDYRTPSCAVIRLSGQDILCGSPMQGNSTISDLIYEDYDDNE